MKIRCCLFCLISLFVFKTSAQVTPEYMNMINKANDFYKEAKYRDAAQTYIKAFQAIGGSDINSIYNTACCWALAGEKDSAFVSWRKPFGNNTRI